MDLVRARVALRERPLLDVLDLAVRFCVTNLRSYAKLSLVTVVPAFALSWAVADSAGWLFGWPVAVALSALVDAPFVALASRLVFADEARVRDVVRAAAAATPRLAAVRLAQGLALGASLALLGLPWLWLGSALLFVPEVVVLEGASATKVWGRAAGIASARMGVVMAAMLLLMLLLVGATLLADVAGRELLESVLEIRPPLPLLREGGSLLALIGFWSVLPIRATTRFFVYLDVRTRTEGWDIQTRFAALATREAGEVAAALEPSRPSARPGAPPRAA
jgi:hypothetical protein